MGLQGDPRIAGDYKGIQGLNGITTYTGDYKGLKGNT